MGIHTFKKPLAVALTAGLGVILSACSTAKTSQTSVQRASPTSTATAVESHFTADRKAILAMTGDYKITFNFTETVSFQAGYELKKPYLTGGHEMVRVIEDTGTFISLQHILIIGDGEKTPYFPIKHWRQDWQYEPAQVLEYSGANIWKSRTLTAQESAGKWSQSVYQVDDAPRYAAVAAWDHTNGGATWTSPVSLRPLPRRDATKRDDYHAISAVNRHALTPAGWVHEQDNSKLILVGNEPRILVREVGINTYSHTNKFETAVGTKYWTDTKDFWKEVRAEWGTLVASNERFGLTVLGEPAELYMQMLGIAAEVADGTRETGSAVREAKETLHSYINTKPRTVQQRLTSETASLGD